MKNLIVLLIAALGIISADAKIVTTSFSVTPGIKCQNCENKIKSNLRFEKGVKKVTTSLSDQLITITFDNEKTSNGKLIQAFKKAGYTAVPAKAGVKKAKHACKGNHENCSGNHKNCKGNHENCSGNHENCSGNHHNHGKGECSGSKDCNNKK